MPSLRNPPFAALVAAVFFAGTVGVPTLHLAFHALPHDHVGGEIHYHAGEYDDEDHDHHHDREPFDPRHGDSSAAHFSLAISDAPASAIVLTIAPGASVALITPATESRTNAAHVSVQRFRGPPTLG